MSAEVVRIISEALQLPADVAPGDTLTLKGSLTNQAGHIVGDVELQIVVTQVEDVKDDGNIVTKAGG